METKPRRIAPCARALALAVLGLWLFAAGGCAMLPFALTSAASFALPQTASLAMTGVKSAYQTAQLAADERDLNTIVRDNMLTLKAKSALLNRGGGGDVHVYAYNGDVFAVGMVHTQADRDTVILALREIKGVEAVKGLIRLKDPDRPDQHTSDMYLENETRLSLARFFLHKNAGVQVEAVGGELCLIGVVGNHAEALDLIQFVESTSGARAVSLLAIRDEYAGGGSEVNDRYRLHVSAEGRPAPPLLAEASPLPSRPVALPRVEPPRPQAERPVAVNAYRAKVQTRLTFLAKREANPQARAELMTLAGQVAQDRDLSITDRLSAAAGLTQQQHARIQIQHLLASL